MQEINDFFKENRKLTCSLYFLAIIIIFIVLIVLIILSVNSLYLIITLIGNDQSIIENVNTEILILPPFKEVVRPLSTLMISIAFCLCGYLAHKEILFQLQKCSLEYKFLGQKTLINISKALLFYTKVINVIVLILTSTVTFIIIYKYVFQLYDIISDAALLSFCILMASVIFSYFSSIEPYYQKKNEKKIELMKSTGKDIVDISHTMEEYCNPLQIKIDEISDLYNSIGLKMKGIIFENKTPEILKDIIEVSSELEAYLENKYADPIINENIKQYLKTIKNYNYNEINFFEFLDLRSSYANFYYSALNRMQTLIEQKKELEDFFTKMHLDYY